MFALCISFTQTEMKVRSLADGIELSCPDKAKNITRDTGEHYTNPLKLDYKDSNTGEYLCYGEEESRIFVKFRSKF